MWIAVSAAVAGSGPVVLAICSIRPSAISVRIAARVRRDPGRAAASSRRYPVTTGRADRIEVGDEAVGQLAGVHAGPPPPPITVETAPANCHQDTRCSVKAARPAAVSS